MKIRNRINHTDRKKIKAGKARMVIKGLFGKDKYSPKKRIYRAVDNL